MTARGWYNITARAGATRISIFDHIGEGGTTAGKFIEDLKAIKGPIELAICSVGGDVFQGLAIHDALRRRGQVTAQVDLAASIASIIALAAERVVVNETGYFVLHSPSAMVIGQAGDLRTMADRLDQLEGTMAEVYRRRTGQAEATVKQWLADETWFDAKQSVAARLADAIDGAPAARAVASLDLSRFRNVPATLSAPAATWDKVIAKFPAKAGR